MKTYRIRGIPYYLDFQRVGRPLGSVTDVDQFP